MKEKKNILLLKTFNLHMMDLFMLSRAYMLIWFLPVIRFLKIYYHAVSLLESSFNLLCT